ncbi:MAG: hypothetical protein COB17_08205 [Sulfurimonas sp.]|nr:MAG: hypothetical protein COB17_08205 [Sulfurimonas sp.]
MINYDFIQYLLKSFLLLLISQSAYSHDPVFALGPHVIFKDGIELSSEFKLNKKASKKTSELYLEFTYGLSGDLAIGVGEKIALVYKRHPLYL